MPRHLPDLPRLMVDDAVKAALLEDWGRAGDITSQATIPATARAKAVIAARKPGVLSGVTLAESGFRQTDASLSFAAEKQDGDRLEPVMLLPGLTGRLARCCRPRGWL